MHLFVSSYDSKSKIVTIILCLSQKPIIQYLKPFTLKNYIDNNSLPPFIYIHNTNKQITTKYNTHPNKDPTMIFIGTDVKKEYVIVPIHQVKISKEMNIRNEEVSDTPNEYFCIFIFNEYLYR